MTTISLKPKEALKDVVLFKREQHLHVKNESRFITGALNTGMRHADHALRLRSALRRFVGSRSRRSHRSIHSRASARRFFSHITTLYIDDSGCPISTVYHAYRFVQSWLISRSYGPVKHLHCWKVESALAIGGMDESLGPHGADDYDFPWCMAEAGCSFKAVAECLYYKRDHREHYRLTTHIPMETQLDELRKIWRKHGMTEKEIEYQTNVRKDGYLRQALYVDEEDKKRKDREGYDIRQGWRLKLSMMGARRDKRHAPGVAKPGSTMKTILWRQRGCLMDGCDYEIVGYRPEFREQILHLQRAPLGTRCRRKLSLPQVEV